MKKIKAVWELLRLEHGVMIFLGILIGSLIALEGNIPSIKNLILTFFTALFLEASTFALNDYYDLDIDKKNKRTDRPLVRGDLSPKTAVLLFFIFFPLGIISSFFVNYTCFIIALITAFLAILYDAKMKKVKLIGNFYIAYVMAIPFVFGGAAAIQNNNIYLNVDPAIYIVAVIAFFAGSGREIMKDVQDYEGDKEKGVKSFPRYIGKRNSNIIAALFYIAAVTWSFLPFSIKQYNLFYQNYVYLVIVIITDILLVIISVNLLVIKKPNLKLFRKLSLIAIFIGLISFLSGTFIQI